jgi:hypothetical protein
MGPDKLGGRALAGDRMIALLRSRHPKITVDNRGKKNVIIANRSQRSQRKKSRVTKQGSDGF